jgi:hypothetical protein
MTNLKIAEAAICHEKRRRNDGDTKQAAPHKLRFQLLLQGPTSPDDLRLRVLGWGYEVARGGGGKRS